MLTIHKSFIRSHLNYRDIVYDELTNDSYRKKLEGIQYNGAQAITGAIKETSQGAIKETSQVKLYKELCL